MPFLRSLARQFNPRREGSFLNRFATALPTTLQAAGAPTFSEGFGGGFAALENQQRYQDELAQQQQLRSLQMGQFQQQQNLMQRRLGIEEAQEKRLGRPVSGVDIPFPEAVQAQRLQTLTGRLGSELERAYQAEGLPGESLLDFRGRWATAGRATALTAPDGGQIFTPEGIDVAARQYIRTGTMPPFGMGTQAAQARIMVLNEAGRLAAEGVDPQTNAALYRSYSGTMVQLQRSLSSIRAYKNTAKRNIEVLLEEAEKVPQMGIQVANSLSRAFKLAVGGENEAAYNAALGAIQPEVARILFNPNLVGLLSDEARREAQEIIPGRSTIGQLRNIIRIINIDMDSREQNMTAEFKTLENNIRSLDQPVGTGPTGTLQTPTERVVRGSDGSLRVERAQ